MHPLQVTPIPALSDNYIWLLQRGAEAAVVDPGEAAPVLASLERLNLSLRAILLTHHHPDHVAGVGELVRRTGSAVIGPAADAYRMLPLSQAVRDGDEVVLATPSLRFDVLAVPGHTLGHVAYHGEGLLLAGDTLFSAGCGRMFEGEPRQYHASLERLGALPEATQLCCGHEYTVDNLVFATSLLPADADLASALATARRQRASGRATLPSTLGWERRHNVYLRCGEPAVASAVDATGAAPWEVFARVRKAKDGFRAA